jgi:hypothetical protein
LESAFSLHLANIVLMDRKPVLFDAIDCSKGTGAGRGRLIVRHRKSLLARTLAPSVLPQPGAVVRTHAAAVPDRS